MVTCSRHNQTVTNNSNLHSAYLTK